MLHRAPGLFQEYEENRHYQEKESHEMVPLESLVLEHQGDYEGENRKGDDLLYDLELDKAERSAVLGKPDPVRRNLGAVLEKGDTPGKEDHTDERPAGRHLHLLELEVAVPGYGHEDIGSYQQQYSIQSFHCLVLDFFSGAQM